MKWTRNHDRSGAPFRLRSRLGFGAVVFLGVVLLAAQQGQQAVQEPASVATTGAHPATPTSPGLPGQAQNIDHAEAQRKKQIAAESARLLALATDLKVEVDKSNKDTLSLTVVRKAGEIERLAHSVKERMKLASAGR